MDVKRGFIAVVALGLLGSVGVPAARADLVYAPWTPAVVYTNRVVFPRVFREIDKETNGAIKWRLVPGGQLASPKESYKAAQDGVVQAAFGIAIYVPNLVPSLNTIYSTLVFDGGSIEATPAALETFHLNCPSCLEEFKKINIVPLSGWTTSQYYLACREPITRVQDLKGKRIRGTGGPAQLWQLAGAIPVSSTLPESLTLLQRGGLDCMHTTYGWLQTFSYVWKKFTPEQKRIHLRKAAYISAAQAAGEFTVEQYKYLARVREKKHVKVIEVQEAGFQKLVDRFEKVQRDSVIAAAKNFGVADPGAIIDAYKKNRAKWTKLTAGIGTNIAKLDELIWREIYSKIDPDSF